MPPTFLPITTPYISRSLHRTIATTTSLFAIPHPLIKPGPPPAPPKPSPHQYGEVIARRRRQAELLERGQDVRAAPTASKPGAALTKRFWKDVHIKQDDGKSSIWLGQGYEADINIAGHHKVMLDSRAVRAPNAKSHLSIPASKPALAAAIALEWDLLISAAQALKNHFIPLTSLVSRATDIAAQDQGQHLVKDRPSAREEIVRLMLRYLDTDTLLCWAPVKSGFAEASGLEQIDSQTTSGRSLRELQVATATPIIHFLTENVWPGISIHPTLEEDGSLMPKPQTQLTRDVIRGWITGLGPWELAGLERAVLAGKSLLVGARLVVEWSEAFHGLVDKEKYVEHTFTIDDAAEACSLEVSWQTRMWGEVEDTHDVEKEDLRRQLGSVVLLVSGTGQSSSSA